ncbi:DUF5011 domain-containing protein [Stigmatella sp. ncwal1]|uniref:DUF5011 domain-containing protein n=1 Tax=Stigmatella ashevillensis TaxID=2995309 RepID=A0ABT5DIB0_9BACT|nr:immunoglobulin-like domain-containing protein [Stigmatella ashevillena]MDC0713400.1 DUF5011 domain-containing protein [Stigmatella ashevillena]
MRRAEIKSSCVLFVALSALALSCDKDQGAPLKQPTPATARTLRQEANPTGKVLILGTTVTGGQASREAQAATNRGFPVTIVTPAQWKAMTPEDFQKYNGIIIGDTACQGDTSAVQAAIDNSNIWGAAVDGNVVITGSDTTNNGTPQFLENAVSYIVAQPARTGMYISLGCAYQNVAPNTPVPLLKPFGDFTVAGTGCYASGGHIFQMEPSLLSDGLVSNDGALGGAKGCVTRAVFSSYPQNTFAPVALAVDSSGTLPNTSSYMEWLETDDDGNPKVYTGTPYIVTNGAMALSSGCGIGLAGLACEQGLEGNGRPAVPGTPADQTCSFSCQQQWCGDGHVDAEHGEECDDGILNGRAEDASGSIGACTEFCKLPNFETDSPPDAICKNLELVANLTCGADGTVNDGSWDPDEDLIGCQQRPIGPYPVGTTTVTLTCTDSKGNTDSCSATITVLDKNAPTLTLVGGNEQLECAPGTYADPGATAADVCEGNLSSKVAVSGSVNPGAVGHYELTYNVKDTSGNAATPVKRTVAVSDTQPPTLALNGLANTSAECASPYVDPGATASDVCAGNLNSAIVQTGSVNTAVLGTYPIQYNVQDPEGNKAPEISRTVEVDDTLAPVITITGPLEDSFECGAPYTDQGATANDACVGAVPVTATQVGDANQPGSFIISYSATDPSGNSVTSPTTRHVTVDDNAPPTLALRGLATEALECGNPYADPGAIANDACFGDVTHRITVTGAINNKQLGTQTLTYNVTDPAGQSAPAVSRTVNVGDSLAPLITVTGPLAASIECGGSPFVDPGATANDACIGTVPAVPTTVVNPGQEGTVSIKYTAQDTSGNTVTSDASRIVTVADTLPPTLALNGPANLPLECASPFNDPGATANDQCAGDVSSRIQTSGTIDNKLLTNPQTITYTVTDPGGRAPAPVNRTVTVSDTLAPVLALNGNSNDTFECGAAYVDPGATANDACAGDLTSAVVPSRTSIPGGFTITYTVTDPSGNSVASPVTRTVKSDDNTPPVLALNGPANLPLECGTSFTDPGAIAEDVCDDNLNITVTGTVDPAVPAQYTLTYNVTDSAANAAAPLHRTVTVQDTQGPTLALIGPATAGLECGTPFSDPGATANDLCAGDLSGEVVRTGTLNQGAVGNYTLTYNVADPGGHTAAPVSRTVAVSDSLAPVVTVNGPASLAVECGDGGFQDPGATAEDACAGTLPAVPSTAVDPTVPGVVAITYSATDPSGNTGVGTGRTVTVKDTLPPELALLGPGNQPLECGTPYNDPGATADDQCAGDLTGSIQRTGSINNKQLGAQTVSYTVSDPGGRTAGPVSRTVTVDDSLAPTIAVNGPLDQVFECGSTYVDPGATANDLCADDLTANIVATRTPIAGQPGSFTVSYSVTDPSGNTATSTSSRTVHVEDNEAPVLALNGPATQGLECGTPYTDPGATAQDACVGDLTASITRSGTVNPNVPNLYTVIYNVSDPSGQSAPSVTREVNVSDSLAPVITVQGPLNDTFECGGEYSDPGATANDLCYGNLTGAVVATRTTVPGQPGNFTITYSVQDPAGNTATSPVSRTVKVDDDTPPSISLNGPNYITVECSEPFVDPGALAVDLCAGDLPVTVTGNVDTTKAGNYVLSYSAQDMAGNTSPTVTRTVQVNDSQPPAITLLGDNPMSLECKRDTYVEPGATANDLCSGSSTVVADSSSVNPAIPGNYAVNYTATDKSGRQSSAIRDVNVVDTLPPALALVGPAHQPLECGTPYTDPGATANDLCFGDLTASVQRSGSIDNKHLGAQTVSYSVTDPSGYTTTPVNRTVTVSDTLAPAIAVQGPLSDTFACGGEYADPGAIATDVCAGNLTSHVVATRAPVPGKPGTFTITYSVQDPSGNKAVAPVTRTVTESDISVHLNDYNVFLLEDYTLGTDVEGRVAAGGNISMTNFSVGWKLPPSDTAPVLVAGGNLTLSQGGVWGDAAYGGTYKANNVTYVRGAPSQGSPVDFATRASQIRTLSTRLASLPANSLTRRESWGGLMLSGASPSVNVFDVNASDFTGTVLLSIDAPTGSLAVINIRGASATLSGGHSFSGGIDQRGVLFNFVDATSINANRYSLWGTLLAPNAHVNFTNGSFDGGLYAKSLSGNAEGHLNPLGDWDFCAPSLLRAPVQPLALSSH